MRRCRSLVSLWAVLVALPLVLGIERESLGSVPELAQAVQAPVLEWQHGGCYSSWCETGWYSSPAVVDLDSDGTMEVIGGAYTVFILNGEDGTVQRSMDTPGSRIWPGVVVADVDGDGDLEIVTAQGGGYVNLLDHAGNVVWTRQPSSQELRGLSVYDLDDDGTLEIILTAAVGSKTNTWVYEHNGTLRAGWPQLINDTGYAYGVFNDNAAVGDLDGDGRGEIVVPSDVHYICAYEASGEQIHTHLMYGDRRWWGKVGVHVDHNVDLRGYANCGVEHRPNFAHTPANIVDVNGDDVQEVVVMGNVYNCGTSPYTSLYEMAFIFNGDRSRWGDGLNNWTAIPVPDSKAAPLSENYGVIENNQANPVTADLDGDGSLEILFPSYDGRLHAYWLDKSEHGHWPYSVYNAAEGFYRFASEPVVADLNDDGYAEILFGSWPQKGTHQTGKLHILDYLGNPIHEVSLPPAKGSPDWNGVLAAPTLANIDGDANLEAVLNTSHSGFVAYELPGTANARILWGTGRGNYQRTGSFLQGTLSASALEASPIVPGAGDPLIYTLTLRNPGPELTGVRVTETLPSEVHVTQVLASSGSYSEAGGVIVWTGAVPAADPVTIVCETTVDAQVSTPNPLLATALIDDGLGHTLQRQAVAIVNGLSHYLPTVQKQ